MFKEQLKSIKVDLSEGATHNFELNKVVVEMYMLLWHGLVMLSETKNACNDKSLKVLFRDSRKLCLKSSLIPSTPKQTTGKKSSTENKKTQRHSLLHVLEDALALELSRILIQQSEYDCFIK